MSLSVWDMETGREKSKFERDEAPAHLKDMFEPGYSGPSSQQACVPRTDDCQRVDLVHCGSNVLSSVVFVSSLFQARSKSFRLGQRRLAGFTYDHKFICYETLIIAVNE